jgi:hypothetical protein
MEDTLKLAQVFEIAASSDPELIKEGYSMNCRTEHRNSDGDVYYLFADGSIYSVKDGASFCCLDSMKDVLLETYGAMQEECETLDELLKLKCA